MALTMFWRCEGVTLDGTHDYNAYGSVTASLVSGALINSDAARVGTNSIDAANSSNDWVTLPAAALSSIFSPTAGSIGFWFRASAWGANTGILGVNGANAGDYVNLLLVGTSASDMEFMFGVGSSGFGDALATTTTANCATNNWYFITLSWQSSGMRIRVYDNSLSLLQEVTNGTVTIPGGLASSCTIGTWDAGGRHFIDNIFVGDAYADADTFVTKATITSYTEYSGAAASAPSSFMGFGGRMIG